MIEVHIKSIWSITVRAVKQEFEIIVWTRDARSLSRFYMERENTWKAYKFWERVPNIQYSFLFQYLVHYYHIYHMITLSYLLNIVIIFFI